MKATGIVRRVDDLNRIVISKEIHCPSVSALIFRCRFY